jgi:thiol-disulfide isomerase/thioredoxin
MKKNTLLLALIIVLSFVIGGYFGLKRYQVEKPESAPANFFVLSMPDDGGKMQEFAQWKGKTLILNFWATWCAPCVQEMPDLSALQIQSKGKNLQILGIGIDSASNIKEFVSKYPVNYPLYVAGMDGSELSRQFGNQGGGLPFTVLLGPDGRIRKTYLGRLKMDELRADLAGI